MKLLYGHPPTQALDIGNPAPLRCLPLTKMSGYGLLVGVVLVLLWGLPFLSVYKAGMLRALDTHPPIVFILGLFITVVIHELVHAAMFPDALSSKRCIIGLLPKTMLAFAWCGLPMRRNRYLLVALTPLFILSFLPLLLYPVYRDTLYHVLPYAFFNMSAVGGDLLVVYFVLRQIPRDKWIQSNGATVFWGQRPDRNLPTK